MTDVVGIIKLRQHIAKYVSEAHAGEMFIIVRNNEPVARLGPYREDRVNNIAFLEGAEYEAALNEREARQSRARRLWVQRLASQALEQADGDRDVAELVLTEALLLLKQGFKP